ncbi:MAG: L,D-transpeptidase [Deltaproteobacteria bacterium]|nr:L,D-transpeptidase [Deltaproteobacteria bacterium]
MGERIGNRAAPGRANPTRLVVFSVLCLICTLFVSSCSSFSLFSKSKKSSRYSKWNIAPPEPPKTDVPYRDVNLNYPLTAVYAPKIYVYKGERRLLLVNDQTLVRDYKVGLGPNPNGDKFMKGDGRTPEGDYFICAKNPQSKFYKSLGLSYPSNKHAEQAYACGYISREDYERIMNALSCRNLPPYDTVLGGAIFIHGGGCRLDWTEGCVALYNGAMDELFDVVSIGTPVHIYP